jgi:hypothetical protein
MPQSALNKRKLIMPENKHIMYWQVLSPEGLAATISAKIDDIFALQFDEGVPAIARQFIPDTPIELWHKGWDEDAVTYQVNIAGITDSVFDIRLGFDADGYYQSANVSRYREGQWIDKLNAYHALLHEKVNQEIIEAEALVDDRIRTAFAPIDDKDLLIPKLTSELVKTESPKSINTLIQELNGDDLAEDCELEDYINDGWEIIQISVHSDALNRLIRTVTLQLS